MQDDTASEVPTLPSTPGKKRVDIAPVNIEVENMPRKCYPGQLWCDDTFQFLMACDSKGNWRHSATCGKLSNGIGCCKLSGVSPTCDCGNEQPPLLQGIPQPSATLETAYLSRRAPSVAQETDPTAGEGPCTPGQRMCSVWQRWSIKCDSNGKWQPETDCGFMDAWNSYGCCKDTPSGPVCDCHWNGADEHAPFARSEPAEIAEVAQQVEESAEKCTSGQYWCSKDYTWIIVCDVNGQWQNAAKCGATSEGYGCCRGGAVPFDRPPSCDCTSLPGTPLPPAADA